MKATEIKLPFGLNENNVLVHIADAKRGRECACVCPCCCTPLIAAKGEKIQPHFRHDIERECKGGLESAIHMAAKQIIKEKSYITLPKFDLVISKLDSKGKEYTEQEAITPDNVVIQFDSVCDEVGLNGIIADILATTDNRNFIIEIFYRHKVEDEKRKKITKAGISAIEIDLSKLRPEDVKNWETFWECVNDPQNIQWLHCVDAVDHAARLESRLNVTIQVEEEKYQKESLELEKKWQKEKESFLLAVQDIKHKSDEKTIAQIRDEAENHRIWKGYCNDIVYPWNALPSFLNTDVPNGDWIFGCDRRIWQSALYCNFICKVKSFAIKHVDIWLQTIGCRVPDSVKIVEENIKKFPQLILSEFPGNIPSSLKTLHYYFNYLCEIGVLEFSGGFQGTYWYKILSKKPILT